MRTGIGVWLVTAIVIGFVGQVRAEDSFNGWWRLDEKASTGVPAMMRGHQTTVHLTQSGDRFTIAFVFDGQAMNTSEFVLDGRSHEGQLGATQVARWANRPRVIDITIHRPPGGPMGAGTEHLVWELEPGGQSIRRTSTNPETKAPPQIYVYRRMENPERGDTRGPRR
jgi:hypothetical protein